MGWTVLARPFDLFTADAARIVGPLGTATWNRERQTATSGTASAVGLWSTTATVQQVPWRVTLYIMPNGRFELNSRVDDAGMFSVENGTWYLKSARGFPQNGTYARIDGHTVTMTGPPGTATWTKQ